MGAEFRVTRQIPEKYFKHMEGTKGLYEIRIEVGRNIYRIFSLFDKRNIVVLGNAFQKKTQKTPKQEIEKALKIMEEYYYEIPINFRAYKPKMNFTSLAQNKRDEKGNKIHPGSTMWLRDRCT